MNIHIVAGARYRLPSGSVVDVVRIMSGERVDCIYVASSLAHASSGVSFSLDWFEEHASSMRAY